MTTPKGGRGIKAEHPTTVVRVPTDIKRSIEFASYCYKGSSTDIILLISSEILRLKGQMRDTRDWTKFKELLERVESELPIGYLEHIVYDETID